MRKRRRFFHFLVIRYGILYAATFLFFWLGDDSLNIAFISTGLVILVTSVFSFLQFDSLPIALSADGGLSVTDPSGKEVSIREFALRNFLWFTRLSYIYEGKLFTLPSEAYPNGFSDISPPKPL